MILNKTKVDNLSSSAKDVNLFHSSFGRFIAEYERSCGAAVETAGRRVVFQLENHLRETLELLKLSDLTSAVGNFNHMEAQIQQLLSAEHTQTSRLAKLESSCLSSRSAGAGFGLNGKNGLHLQEVTPGEVALDEVLAAMKAVKAELDEELKSSRQRRLPAGKPSILSPAVCLL